MRFRENTEETTTNLIVYFTEVGTRLGVGEDTLNIIKIIFRDNNPRLRLAYLFGETEDNQVSSFQAAGQMKQKGLADKFLICGYPAVPGYPGGPAWREYLAKYVGSDNVGLVPFSYPLLNTKTESMALVHYLKKKIVKLNCI